MRSVLPTDKKSRPGFVNKEYLDFVDKIKRERKEAHRYWISTAISIIALIVAIIALLR